jgi:hypothetical protein
MDAVLTHPWGFERQPNLLHRPGLTSTDEAGELSFPVDGFRVKVKITRGLYISLDERWGSRH